jgi:hypothetical protein
MGVWWGGLGGLELAEGAADSWEAVANGQADDLRFRHAGRGSEAGEVSVFDFVHADHDEL